MYPSSRFCNCWHFSMFASSYTCLWASLVAQTVKNLPAMQETGIQPLGWEDLLRKVFLPGEFHGQRSLAGYSPWGCKESDEWLSTHTYLSFPSFVHWSVWFIWQILKICVYLAVPGLGCGTQDLPSLLRRAGSLVEACELLVSACGI